MDPSTLSTQSRKRSQDSNFQIENVPGGSYCTHVKNSRGTIAYHKISNLPRLPSCPTMVLSHANKDFLDNTLELKGYPKSHVFAVGYELGVAGHIDAAVDVFQRGAENNGCVP